MRRCRVLHSTWLARDELLAFWGEDGTLSSTSVPRRSRHPKHPRPVPHPFALDADGIRLAAGEVGGVAAEDLIVKAREVDLHLRLPGAGGGPIGSPLLEDDRIGFAPGSPGDPLPWTAAGLVLDPFDAARLVLALGTAGAWDGPAPETPEVALGTDLRFAARAAEVVLELLTRGRLLPVLERTAQGSVARWRPLVDRHDRGRVEMLCWNLPGSFVCADAVDPAREPGGRAASGCAARGSPLLHVERHRCVRPPLRRRPAATGGGRPQATTIDLRRRRCMEGRLVFPGRRRSPRPRPRAARRGTPCLARH